MDILHLVDRLEELFNEARAFPFTRNVMVDEDKMLDIIDQMRVTIPDEVKKAQQLVSQKDRILAQAQEEAGRIVSLAKEKAEQIVEREAIVKSAKLALDKLSTRRARTPTPPAAMRMSMLSRRCRVWRRKPAVC